MGFDAIEWAGDAHVAPGNDTAAAQILMDTLRAGLTVASYAPLYRVDPKGETGLGFAAILSAAAALHAPIVRVFAGGSAKKPGMPTRANGNGFETAAEKTEDRAALVAELRRLGDLADPRGVTICLSLGNRTALHSYEAARALVAEAAHPFIRAAWEPLPGATMEEATSALSAGDSGYALLMARRCDRDGRASALREEADEWRSRLSTFATRAGDPGMGRFVLLGRMGEDDPERLADDARLLREIAASLNPAKRSQ